MSGIVGASLGKAKRPELIVVDVKPSDEPVYSPQVAKRLEERLKTPTDSYDIFLKHKNAEDRARECLSPLKTIEHNIKVQEVGLRAKVEDHAKRAARESDLKERHDRARQMRAQAIEDTRAKASEVSKKLVDAMHTMTVKEQVRQEELVTKITKKQLNASGTRSETLHGVKSKAATVVQKQEEAALRLKVEEEQKLLEKFNQIEEKLTAAELRRQAVQEEARGQAAKAREHHKEVQRRAGEDSAAVLAFQLHSKLASAEQKRQEVLEEVRSKASEACTPKGSGGGQPGEKLAQLEARVAAAEQRKTQVLVETQLRAAAVAKKAADVVANAKSMQETATAQAAEAIREKLDSAQKRVEEAQQARTQGLSKYMAYLNTKSSPSRESGSSPRSGGRPSIDGAALPPSMQEALAEEVALCDADEQQ